MTIVVAIAEVDEVNGDAVARTRASIGDRAHEVHVITGEVLLQHGKDLGAARTAILQAAAAQHGPSTIMVALEAGETVDASSWAAIAAFGEGTGTVGRVRFVEERTGVGVRHLVARVVRAGGSFTGRCIDRPVADGTDALLAATFRGRSPFGARNHTRLADEIARQPDDPYARIALAQLLLDTQPATAATHANAAVERLDVAHPDMPGAILTLARALLAAERFDELLGLAEACRETFPALVTLTLLEGRALAALGQAAPMVNAYERCFAQGEHADMPGLVGAGSFLPALDFGRFALTHGDRAAARKMFALAVATGEGFAPAAEALAALDALDAVTAEVTKKPSANVPPRLSESASVATKACRHGVLSYPVNDTFVGKALDLYGEWCEAELETLRPLVPVGGVVVDVGANIGTHAVAFARHVGPTGRVVALEPQAFAHALLAANAQNNGLGQIECLRVAAGETLGTAAIPVVDATAACNFGALAVQLTSSAGTEDVPMTTIDALGLETCALLKIDVEGLECAVLEGARATIRRTQPVLFVENNTVERSRSILQTVESLGYRAYWHIAPYYRQANFFANQEDVFGKYHPEANLVCVPAGRELASLMPVSGLGDDFVQAARRGAMEASRTLPVAAATKARPLRIIACIPGREFSGRFFDCWNEFSAKCRAIGIELTISRQYDAVVYYARNKVAGGSVKRGPQQAPWAGERDYDYMLWIDSDVIFTFEDFQALLRHKVDIAAGLYLMADNARFAAVEHMDPKAFEQHGEFEFLTPAGVKKKSGLFKVDYTGFGFVLVRRGVFEKMSYPWFRPIYFEAPGGANDFTSEDVGFCLDAKKAGVEVFVDPNVIVGHEKPVVLDPRRLARAGMRLARRAA